MASKASKYQILRMETVGTPPLMRGNKPYVFTDPQEASVCAKHYSKELGEKMCVKPIVDGAWRDREFQRLYDGTYRKLSWELAAERWWRSDSAYAIWKDHYPHASLEKPGWIAYTKSEEDGEKDKQSLLRPGSYLNKYFEKVLLEYGVGERGRVEAFMQMYGPIDINFAETEADILKVYEYGPKTCMNGKHWPNDTHPATIYAAGDLQVAYIGDLEKGKVSARVLVWPQKKTHSRIYGDIARMTQGLGRLGYKWGAPIGARLKRIQLEEVKFDGHHAPRGCFLMPYLDRQNQAGGGHLSFKDAGDHLIICREGEPGSHHAGLAEGRSGQYVPRDDEYPTFTCERCERKKLREVYPVFDADPGEDDDGAPVMWCPDCYARYARQCNYSGNWFTKNVEMVTVNECSLWAKYYAKMYAAPCEGNGNLYNVDDLKLVHFPDGSKKKLSQSYIKAQFKSVFQSNLTHKYYPFSEMVHCYNNFGGMYCSKAELARQTFECSECKLPWVLEARDQVHGDDRLFCPTCAREIKRNLGIEEAPKPQRKKGG